MPVDFGVGEAAAAGAAAEAGSAAAVAGAAGAGAMTYGELLGLSGAATTAGTTTTGGFLASLASATPYISLASGAISAVSAIVSATSRYSGAGLQSDQYAEQADIAKTQALEQETQRERSLMAAVGSADAMRAGRGVNLYSPTGLNINRVSEQYEQSDETQIAANESSQIASAAIGEQASAGEQVGAITSGVSGVTSGLLSSAKGAQDLMKKASDS